MLIKVCMACRKVSPCCRSSEEAFLKLPQSLGHTAKSRFACYTEPSFPAWNHLNPDVRAGTWTG